MSVIRISIKVLRRMVKLKDRKLNNLRHNLYTTNSEISDIEQEIEEFTQKRMEEHSDLRKVKIRLKTQLMARYKLLTSTKSSKRRRKKSLKL